MSSKIVNNIYVNRLKSEREKKGLSQREMAKKLGYSSVTSYMNIEKAYIEPSINKMNKISSILGKSVDYFFNLNIQKNQYYHRKNQ